MFKLSKKHRQVLSNSGGFSLIELLVSIALLGIMLTVAVSVFMMVNGSHKTSVAIGNLQTQGSQMVEVIERAIRSSSQATMPAVGTEGCESQIDSVDITSCLKLQAKGGSIEYSLNGSCTYTYYAWAAPTEEVNGRLWRYSTDSQDAPCQDYYELVDSNPFTGISVETSASPALFSVEDSGRVVRVSLFLAEGVKKITAAGDNRATVTLNTVTRLRDY